VPVFHACWTWMLGSMVPGAYWGETARVKHFDEVLSEAISDGIQQVVVLGAGLDSRAYRIADRLDSIRFFEVDHPATSIYKRERVEAAFGSLPAHVTYVPHDLTVNDLGKALIDAGFSSSAPTLALWIGVSMYLGPEITHSVLRWTRSLPERSLLAFDYLEQRFFEDKKLFGVPQRMRFLMALGGERLVYGVDSAAVPALLEEYGLALKSHLGPADAETKYLTRRSGRTAGQSFPYFRYVEALVTSVPS